MNKLTTLRKSVEKSANETRSHVERLRTEIRSLQEERDWLETGPLPKQEAIDLVIAYIDDQAGQFDVQALLGGAVYAGREINQELARLFQSEARLQGYSANAPLGPMLCHFFPEQIKERLTADIQAMNYQEGPPAAERAALIADLDRRIHVLEVEEEAVIEVAEEAGIEILRRPDCNPAIVLQLEVIEEETPDKPHEEAMI